MHFFPANQTQIKNLEVLSVLSAVNSHLNLDNNINDLEKILTSFESICKGMEKREKIRKWTIIIQIRSVTYQIYIITFFNTKYRGFHVF